MTGLKERAEAAAADMREWCKGRVVNAQLRGVLQSYASLLSELAAAVPEWRPISEAPKDGERVLLWVCSRGSVRRGLPMIGYWDTDGTPGWCRSLVGDLIDGDAVKLWQPLPAPPTDGDSK